jgi:predicted O-methyltransferase YrrM
MNTAKIKQLVTGEQSEKELLRGVCEGIANLAEMQNNKLSEVVSALHYIAHQQQEQMKLIRELLGSFAGRSQNTNADFQAPPQAGIKSTNTFKEAMANIPLLLDEKTYNTAHPDYDANAVRNYPCTIFNYDKPCSNVLYKELLKLAKKDTVPDKAWDKVLKEALEEAKTVPGADQVFERKAYIEQYMKDIGAKYGAHYVAGWVNIEDALFLYWMIRKLKPKTIVQTGVCNGLSSAFMMLALAKNGNEGTLHVVDLAAVFNPNDPEWTVRDKVYGVVIPEGQTSGWIVPDMYQGKRFFVQNGDAKVLLPKLIDSLDSIDMFYHDSDHTYNHMMFEFREAKKKLNPGGLIVGDDISWNASVWDFADQYGVPSYNYKGAVGVAFF